MKAESEQRNTGIPVLDLEPQIRAAAVRAVRDALEHQRALERAKELLAAEPRPTTPPRAT